MPEKKTILLFEDEEILYENLVSELEDDGFIVVLAKDGQDALNKVIATMPDIILLDLILPKQNGFEILKDIKNNDKVKNIPVIILSNLCQDQDKIECGQLGAVAYIVKSDVLISDISAKIKQYIK